MLYKTPIYGGSSGTLLANINRNEIRYIKWSISNSYSSIIIEDFTERYSDPFGNDNDIQCNDINNLNRKEHINKIKIISGKCTKSNICNGGTQNLNLIRGIIFYTNEGQEFSCIAVKDGDRVDVWDVSSTINISYMHVSTILCTYIAFEVFLYGY